MRELTEKLYFALDNETQVEKAKILTDIDEVELFHSTDFALTLTVIAPTSAIA